ncbi:MAG: hypothetical protein HY034_05655 [Nitrospirae bacterium]|nr:hypothetical protein [Nitrospirota bacterium]
MRSIFIIFLVIAITCAVTLYADSRPTKAKTIPNEFLAKVPEGYTVIEMTESDCGWGYLYTVKEGKYTVQEILWLGKVIGFMYGGKRGVFEGVEFEDIAQGPVSSGEINVFLKQESFRTWAGTELVKMIDQLDRARIELYVNAKELPKGKDLFNHQLMKRYFSAQELMLRYIVKHYGVIKLDNGVDCD